MIQNKLSELITLPILIAIGALKDSLLCSLIFWTTCRLVRKYAGGMHFSNEYFCAAFSGCAVLLSAHIIVPIASNTWWSYFLLLVSNILMIVVRGVVPNPKMHLTEVEIFESRIRSLTNLVVVDMFITLMIGLNQNLYAAYSISSLFISALSTVLGKFYERRDVNGTQR